MDNLPSDPAMLMSIINMKLRDGSDSLDEICNQLGCQREALCEQLATAGYEYDETRRRFW